MRPIKTIPLFLFLLPLFFCLHGSVENFGYVNVLPVIKLFIIILVILLLLFLIIRFYTKNTVFAALIAFYIGLWNLFFGTLHYWIKSTPVLSWLGSYTVLVPFLFASIIILAIVLKKHKAFQHTLLYYLNLLLLIYCLYDFTLLISRYAKGSELKKVHVAFDHSKVTARPDVYYLLFDGYPGYKSLKDYFGYANDSLYHFLTNKGFKILPSRSNYNLTYFSMESVFNMEYVNDIAFPDSITQIDYLRRINGIKNAEVFSIFTSMGYSIQNLSLFDIRDQHKIANNPNVISGIDLFTYNIFYSKFFRDVGWVLLTGKYEVPVIKDLFKEVPLNKRVEEAFYTNLQIKKDRPAFLYAHFFLPHEPVFFDSAGNALPEEIITNKKTVLDKRYYLGYLKYTNTKIVSFINEIIKKDPDALIIIMSDHGYRSYNNIAYRPYFFDNICAVRFTGNSCAEDQLISSNVNVFRYIFNCTYNQQLPYLKDTSIFLTEK